MSCVNPIPLCIKQGAKFRHAFLIQNEDGTGISLAGKQGRMQLRDEIDGTVILDLTTANGRMVLEAGAEVGRIDITLGATLTDPLTIAQMVYDIEIFDPGDADDVERFIEGPAQLTPQVTK